MTAFNRFSGLVLVLALALSGCDSAGTADYVEQVVVSAFLETDAALPSVFLSRTGPINEPFDAAERAVTNAVVTVERLSVSGTVEATVAYTHTALGQYVPPDTAPVATGGTRYRLTVRAPGFETITAETTVPVANTLIQGPVASIRYLTGQGPEVTISTTSVGGRQAAYIASIQALAPFEFQRVTVDGETRYRSVPNPERFAPVPLVQRFADCEVEAAGTLLCNEDPSDGATGTSPIINEQSYEILPDGSALVRIPWIGFGFYGPARIELISLDAAMQDFVETQATQGGGTTLSPGEIPNVTTNIQGGLGVFGAFARVVVQTTVTQT
jgi:hypothetical protein